MSTEGPGAEAASVSVLIAAWDAERFLAEAIDSALAQTHPPLEVVVVDDGSTDGTAEVAAAFGPPVVLVRAPHEGISASRNRAMARAQGALWAFLDADDRWRPQKLARQVAALHDRPELDAVFTRVDEFIDGPVAGRRPPGSDLSGPLVSSLVIRADVARRIGPFDTSTSAGDWVDWWSRAIHAGTVHDEVSEVLVERRIHDRNNSGQSQRTGEDYLRVLRARLRQQRASS